MSDRIGVRRDAGYRRGRGSAAPAFWRVLTTALLLFGLLAPFATIDVGSAAPKRNTPLPQPLPQRVIAVGSFQGQLGCGDFDVNCQASELTENRDGTWIGTFALAPDNYRVRIVTVSDRERSLGEDGNEAGEDVRLRMPGDAIGAFFSWDQFTGKVTVLPVTVFAQLQTDAEVLDFRAYEEGFEIYVDGQGPVGAQVFFNGEPVGEPFQVDPGQYGRARVRIDATGAVTAIDPVERGSLTVLKADSNGNPVPGSCFSVYTEDAVASQACDGDDGADDGFTTMYFPHGFPRRADTLAESFTPEGQPAAENQQISLSPGENYAEMIVAGAEPTQIPEEPTAVPTEVQEVAYQVNLISIDDQDNFITGACFQIDGIGEACDDAGSGVVSFELLPGSYVVTETVAPEGFQNVGTFEITVEEGGGDFWIRHQPALGTGGDSGELIINIRDDGDNPLAGACFTLQPRGDNVGEEFERCDSEDGADDGQIYIDSLSIGRWRIIPSVTPEGFEAVEEFTAVDVVAGEVAETTVYFRASGGTGQDITGSLRVSVVDQDGFAIIGPCISIAGPENRDVCDNLDGDADFEDGVILFENLATGDYTVTVSFLPGDFEAVEPVTATVFEGETTDVVLVSGALPPEVETGDLVIRTLNENGDRIGGACYALSGPREIEEVCDNGDLDEDDARGRIKITGIEAGEYVISETRAPDGYPAADDQVVTLVANETTRVDFTHTMPSASLTITTVDGDGNPVGGACYGISGGGDAICDDDGDGVIFIETVAVGELEVSQLSVPDGYSPSDPSVQSISLANGDAGEVTFVVGVAQGQLSIFTTDGDGNPLAGACYLIDAAGPFCDDDGDGRIDIGGIAPGTYTVSQSATPAGYETAEDQSAEITAGGQTDLTFVNVIAPGSILITTLDADSGQPLAGACYLIDTAGPFCDDDGDGVVSIGGVGPGTYTVSQDTTPEGYQTAEAQSVSVNAGEETSLTFSNSLANGSIRIATIDAESGDPVPGACFQTSGDGGTVAVCDGDDGENDGKTTFADVAPGTVTVEMTVVPDGYQAPAGQDVEVLAGQQTTVEVAIQLVPPTEAPTEVPTEQPTTEATEEPTQEVTPEVTEEPTTVVTEEPTVEATEIPTVEVETGSVAISKTDGANPLGGACFELSGPTTVGPVCDNEGGDSNPEAGAIQIDGVPVGEYQIIETQAPDGYAASAPVAVTVNANETSAVTIVNTLQDGGGEAGDIRILVVAGDGTPLGGACFTIAGGEVCDNGTGDFDAAPGVVLVTGLASGTYTITETRAPSGYETAADQSAEVPAGGVGEVTFTHEAAPAETGGVTIDLNDADGNPVEGACIEVTSTGGEGAEGAAEPLIFCDGGPEDEDPTPGRLKVSGLPVGAYKVTQANLPDGADSQGVRAAGGIDEETVTVQANSYVIIIIIIIVEPPTTGDLQIVKKASDTNLYLPGACFKVARSGFSFEICDNDGVDANNQKGVIRFVDLQVGTYTVTETQAPTGYKKAADFTIDITPGITTRTVLNQPQPTLGKLTVRKVDGSNVLLPGSCFVLRQGGYTVYGPVCDADDGNNDGRVRFNDIQPGTYRLREKVAPSSDYQLAPDRIITIQGGTNPTVTVVNTLKPGALKINKMAEDGTTPLGGACFGLFAGSGEDPDIEVCDQEFGDSNPAVGVILIAAVPAGDWTLKETQSPDGYDPAADQLVTILPQGVLELTILNTPTPPPVDFGTLIVEKVDEDGNPLAGACFSLRIGSYTKSIKCDVDDGAADGQITFENMAVGSYTLREVVTPSAEYQFAADRSVQIEKDQTKIATIVNELKHGRILVKKVNQDGVPLQGACFRITPDPNGIGKRCTGATGQTSFDNLPTTSTYKVREVVAPLGYVPAPDKVNIHVNPGLTTTVTFINKKAPPKPDDGSILVIKFFCPAGKDGELTKVFDSSNTGSKELAKTAGCTKGNASFLLSSGKTNLIFSTGSDGEFQATLSAGTWSLSELDADGNVIGTETVQVYTGSQTTVVVINYVKPPKPAPVTVNVTKYTCPKAFNGVYFADFIANCTENHQLTNGVTFRLSGAASEKRVTGSGGKAGKAFFKDLPAGTYTLTEDKPYQASTMYGFCGYDPENPDWKSIDWSLSFTLQPGETYHCTWFNVPDDVSDSTGSIAVYKYVCDATSYPSDFDWFGNCSLYEDGAKFSLSVMQEGTFKPKSTGVTNDDGILRFHRLKPGTYQLKEVGKDWCHAESDSVNKAGNVLVQAGKRSTVWIFNCVPPKKYPNTGTGSTATTVDGQQQIGAVVAAGAGSIGLGFAWPALAVAGFAGYRRRSRRHAA